MASLVKLRERRLSSTYPEYSHECSDQNNDPRECIRLECFACDRDEEVEDGDRAHGDGEDQLRAEHLGQSTPGNL